MNAAMLAAILAIFSAWMILNVPMTLFLFVVQEEPQAHF